MQAGTLLAWGALSRRAWGGLPKLACTSRGLISYHRRHMQELPGICELLRHFFTSSRFFWAPGSQTNQIHSSSEEDTLVLCRWREAVSLCDEALLRRDVEWGDASLLATKRQAQRGLDAEEVCETLI